MNKNLILISVVSILMLLVSGRSFSQAEKSRGTLIGNEQKIEMWKDARFGMFIHWGPVTLKGTEIGWSRGQEVPIDEYDALYKRFNPVNFDAEAWVKLAKDAGMKYIIFTSKHHDGFCMWDTKYTDYNIMNSPFKRDVVKELAAACRKYGIALGLYHSTLDWHHPDFPLTSPGGTVRRATSNIDRYTEYLKNQSVELLKNYGPLFVMWYDVPQEFDAIRGQGVIDLVRKTQPDIIINNRTGAKGDFDTPEQRVGGFQNDRPWETCMTIARQWAWKPNDEVKSLEQCLHSLIRSAGGDGNLLFNVGPMSDGRIEPLQVDRLKEMGQWLQKYGNSIYGTRGGPFKPTDWGVSTRKGNTIFLHILKWYGDSPRIVIPDLGMKIKSCRLADGGKVKLTKQGGNNVIEFAGKDLLPINTIVEIEMAGNVMDIHPMDIGSQSLSYNKKVAASSNPNPDWNSVSSINNGDWVGHEWKPAKEDKTPWAEIDFSKPEKVSKVIIYESGKAVNAFELQYKSGEVWKSVYKGTTIGSKLEIKLPNFTAQKVRLLLTGFSQVLGIYEIVLL
ncbi:MAG TPA: alpha-L-fucosidase [Bacteroidales bacterium]